MKRFFMLCANAMAAFMDFGVGTLVAETISLILGIKVQIWTYLIGGILALLPDFDVLWPIIVKGAPSKETNHHETIMHRPIFLLPIATLAGYWIGGEFWAATTFFCVFWHFLHDSPELGGGGIAWFWPVSKKYWSLRGSFSPRPRVANREEAHHRWPEQPWLKPSKMSVREIFIGSTALSISVMISVFNPESISRSLLLGATIYGIVWLPVLVVWAHWRHTTHPKTRA